MAHAVRSDVGDLPPEFLARAEAVIDEMEAWGDAVVDAWLARRDERFAWDSDEFAVYLDAEVRGRSIYYGDCLVTRAQDGFVGIMNGRRLRHKSARIVVQVIQNAIVRRGMTAYVVPLPFPCRYVDEEVLDRWYQVAREWDRLTPRERAARYMSIASSLVDAFLDPESRCETYGDGYYLAQATSEGILVAMECIAARPHPGNGIALVSARRYPTGSFRSLLRTAVRAELEARGITIRDIRPQQRGYTFESDLIKAWKATRPKLV